MVINDSTSIPDSWRERHAPVAVGLAACCLAVIAAIFAALGYAGDNEFANQAGLAAALMGGILSLAWIIRFRIWFNQLSIDGSVVESLEQERGLKKAGYVTVAAGVGLALSGCALMFLFVF